VTKHRIALLTNRIITMTVYSYSFNNEDFYESMEHTALLQNKSILGCGIKLHDNHNGSTYTSLQFFGMLAYKRNSM